MKLMIHEGMSWSIFEVKLNKRKKTSETEQAPSLFTAHNNYGRYQYQQIVDVNNNCKKTASNKFRLVRIEMSRSIEFSQSQIERGTHISYLMTLAQKTEDRLEQMKVVATEVFANVSSERRYGDMCMSFKTTFRANP